MRRLTMTILAACCAVSISSAQSTSRNIDLKAADGQVLKATYFSPGKPGPGIVLIHQGSRARKA